MIGTSAINELNFGASPNIVCGGIYSEANSIKRNSNIHALRGFSQNLIVAKSAFTCSKSTMEATEQCMKSFDVLPMSLLYRWRDFTNFSGVSIVDFEQVNAGWQLKTKNVSKWIDRKP